MRPMAHHKAKKPASFSGPEFAKQDPVPPALQTNPARHVTLALITCLLGGLGAGCSKVSNAQENHRASVDDVRETFPTSRPKLINASDEREYVGKVMATRYAELRARVRGVVQKVAVDEGQLVKANQTLFTLSAHELQQRLHLARAETKTAEAELAVAILEENSAQLLLDKGVVSEAETALARSKVQSLAAKIEETKANVGQASIQLGFAQVRAPFDGVVNRLYHRVGSLVQEDDLLTTVTNTAEVYVYFQLSERDYLAYRERLTTSNSTVGLKLADGTLYPHAGEVDAVASEFDRDTGNLAIRARFTNPAGVLKHGASGTVLLSSQLENVLVVPQKSTFDVQGNLYVYVVDDNDVPHARKITPRLRLKDSFVIESGLDADDRFVLEGVQRITEGAAIDIQPQE